MRLSGATVAFALAAAASLGTTADEGQGKPGNARPFKAHRTIIVAAGRADRPVAAVTLAAADGWRRLLAALQPEGTHATVFKPRRFTGPWYEGSQLGDPIELTIEGGIPPTASAAASSGVTTQWYFGDFFEGVTTGDKQIYSQFFTNVGQPHPAAPAHMPVPGAIPYGNIVHDLRYSLSRVFFSSRYDGSVGLEFQMSEDTLYEAREGNLLWDIPRSSLFLYITPNVAYLNPTGPPYLSAVDNAMFHVEFEINEATCYDVTSGKAIVQPDAHLDQLRDALERVARSVESSSLSSNGRSAAMLFAHAWLRVQNQSQFAANQAPPEIVDAIEISDQFCMLHTHVPQPVLAWHMMITQGASGPEKPIHYDLSALQLGPAGSVIQGPVWGEDLKDFRSTGWLFVGAFDALRECSADNVVRVDVSAHDVDGAALKNVSNSDDSVSSSSASIPQGATTLQEALHVDCGSLAAFIGQAAPGVPSAIGPDQIVMETREDDLVLLRPDMAWRANYSMWARATVVYR